ncbi:MAG: hypothetical protein IJS60_01550 [Abditibacteriota bacterium]|nr:hypothetical protein [Abditibacteriota bacterium]
MKTFYLIDYENLNKKEYYEGCEKIDREDSVIVFYSKDSLSIGLDVISKLNRPEILKVEKGKAGDQSLDKHLLSYLGFIIGQNSYNKDINYVILSKDKGFDLVIDFWVAKGNYNITRKESFSEHFGIVKAEPQAEPEKTEAAAESSQEVKVEKKNIDKKSEQDVLKEKRAVVLNILKKNLEEKVIGKEKRGVIINFVHNHIGNKREIYTELVKILKQEKGLEIYNLIKKEL